MNPLLVATVGSYPRIGDDKDQQRYRRGMANFQNKEISAHAFRDVEQSVIQEIISEQIAYGLDEITDGLIRWHDPISHFLNKFSNTRLSGLQRFFDTNFYYRRPVITGRPLKKQSFVVDEFNFAKQHSSKPIRAVLSGPLTLALHTSSETKTMNRLDNRIKLFTDAITDEIQELEKAGCESIQIDEPSIAAHPSMMPYIIKSITKFRSGIRTAKLILAVYYNPVASLYESLAQLPIDLLHLDFTSDGRRLWEVMVKKPLYCSVEFGLINSRNSRLEAIDPIINILRVWMESRRPPYCYLSPCAGLELLPRSIASSKLSLLSKIRTEMLASHAKT